MNTLVNTYNNIANGVLEAIVPAPHTAIDLTQRQVIGLEEAERSLRISDVDHAQNSMKNASLVSSLLHAARFPYPHVNQQAGLKRLTSLAEEKERARRLYTKPEMALRKSNAMRTAGMIKALGYPFYNRGVQSGPEYIYANPTSLAEEKERAYRLNNPLLAQIAKNNAAFAANAVRWGFPTLGQRGSKRFTRALQENERTRLLSDQEGIFNSIQNAYNTAGLIRHLGSPFYVQGNKGLSGLDVGSIEEQEQQRRLEDPDEQAFARDHAHRVSRLIPRAEISLPAQPSFSSAQQLSREIPSIQYADYELTPSVHAMEEGLQLTKDDIEAAYEQERARKLREPLTEGIARQNAAQVAAMINAAAKSFENKPEERALIEQERLSRMHDRPLMQIQMRNARSVSNLIKELKRPSTGKKTKLAKIEERERDRRMVDLPQKQLAQANARKVSSMIPLSSSVGALPAPLVRRLSANNPFINEVLEPHYNEVPQYPPYITEAQAAPFLLEVPRTISPQAVSFPVEAVLVPASQESASQQALPFVDELLASRPVAPPATLPFKNELLNTRMAAPPAVLPFKHELLETRPEAPAALPFTGELLQKQAPTPAAPLSSGQPSAFSAPRSVPSVDFLPVASAEPIINEAPQTVSYVNSSPSFANVAPQEVLVNSPFIETPIQTPQVVAPVINEVPYVTEMPYVSQAPVINEVPYFSPTPVFDQVPVISQAPSVISSAPQSVPFVSQAPQVAPIVSQAPIISQAPVVSQAPVLSTYDSQIPQAPIRKGVSFGAPVTSSAPISSMPPTSSLASYTIPPSSTYYSAAGTHVMSAPQLKRLQKQADKHNKQAAKEANKANKDATKAQKYHMRGKDSKALKIEGRAVQHNIAAKNHKQWADELLSKQSSLSTQLPSSVVGSPSM